MEQRSVSRTVLCPPLTRASPLLPPARALVQLGGLGFVHYNNTIEEQVAHVAKAKRHTPGMVVTPMVMLPTDPVSKIDALKDLNDFSTVCVTDTGAVGGKLLGIVTPRDIDFVADRKQPLSEVMEK